MTTEINNFFNSELKLIVF